MPIFEVIVEVTTKYQGKIVVDAKSGKDALEYCKNTHEWHQDDIEDDDQYWQEKTPLSAMEIKHTVELSKNYDGNSIPWAGDRKTKLRELLEA